MKQKEILSYFDLESHPFDKEIKTDDLMKLSTIEKASQELDLLIDTKGIGILTGPSGCGKSSLIRKTASELNPGLYRSEEHTSELQSRGLISYAVFCLKKKKTKIKK